ncbi:hypothetical protein ACFL2H_02185 [Planctomycetota bacterium]
MNLSSRLRGVVIAFLLSVAVLVIWLVAVVFVVETRTLMVNPYQSENIEIDVSGTPYISRRSHVGYDTRTLEGTVVFGSGVQYSPNVNPDIVSSAKSHVPNRIAMRSGRRLSLSPRLFCWRAWNAAWYLSRQKKSSDPIYFEGFDWNTGKRIGYIGRAGFSVGVPSIADRFPFIDETVFPLHRLAATCPTGYDAVSGWGGHGGSIFLISADKLFHIDLRQRHVAEIPVLGVPRYVNAGRMHAEDWELTVRTDQSFMLFNGDYELSASYEIPVAIRNAEFLTIHRVSETDAVIEAAESSRGNRDVQLWKVNLEGNSMLGKVALREHVSGIYSAPFRVLAAPSLVANGFTVAELYADDNFYAAEHKYKVRSRIRREIWRSLIGIAIGSGIIGIIIFRLERRAGRAGLQWAIFIFLLGLPGLFGYWFHRKWPSRITCDKCHTVQAHRRHECIFCRADMVTGLPLTTDMFA